MVEASGFITLITDFGLADGFVGTMKGVIYTINPDATIVDISHEIAPQDVSTAGFLLKASYGYFPQGTVHIVVVDPGVGGQRRAIVVETAEYYFVAPDNGVLTRALAGERIMKSVELTNQAYFLDEVSDTFHGRDIFAPAAAQLSLDTAIEAFGVEIDDLVQMSLSEPEVHRGSIKGHIIHTDRFGNLTTDIPRKLFETLVSDRPFVIAVAGIRLDVVARSYADVPIGLPLAVFNSFGNLEIAVNRDSAAEILGAGKGDDVRIKVRIASPGAASHP